MENYFLKSDEILEIAKKIFGDIVKEAYFGYPIRKGFMERYKYLDYNQDKYILILDCSMVALVFENGRKVVFSTSEWAYIESIDKLNLYDGD